MLRALVSSFHCEVSAREAGRPSARAAQVPDPPRAVIGRSFVRFCPAPDRGCVVAEPQGRLQVDTTALSLVPSHRILWCLGTVCNILHYWKKPSLLRS